ncbi:hypothetical protein AYI70_g10896 [Smittium culicis]|uniref:Uncharacterized protein n=1 Tax=Smittium culicis TaxID=133412 RepID=A0A1R1X4F4_9FUNG|nr:hypothetical protein AYI70_g10896 [Smittium culicis]
MKYLTSLKNVQLTHTTSYKNIGSNSNLTNAQSDLKAKNFIFIASPYTYDFYPNKANKVSYILNKPESETDVNKDENKIVTYKVKKPITPFNNKQRASNRSKNIISNVNPKQIEFDYKRVKISSLLNPADSGID